MPDSTPIMVSIIITNYNYAHFLADALESVQVQTFQDWECLIIDDGSIDNSSAIAEKYTLNDKRFRYIYQDNQGLAASRNNGMLLAKGQYYQFLDADDKICTNKLSEQVRFLNTHSDVDIVYGDYAYFETEQPHLRFSSKNKKEDFSIHYPTAKGTVMLSHLLVNNFTVVSAPLIRSSIVTTKGIQFDTSYQTFEDWRFWIDCALADCKFQYCSLPETETLIRFGHSSMMSALIKMNLGGQKIRKYLQPHLNGLQKIYNRYRLLKLIAKYNYLKTFGQ